MLGGRIRGELCSEADVLKNGAGACGVGDAGLNFLPTRIGLVIYPPLFCTSCIHCDV